MRLGDWVGWLSLVGLGAFTVLDRVTASMYKKR